jgi:RHS repeat-associated protein
MIVPFYAMAQQGNDTLNFKFNFRRSWKPAMPVATPAQITNTTRTTAEVRQTTEFYNGMSKPVQSVIKKITASGYDMVQTQTYDSVGKDKYNYLPYASNVATGDEKTNSLTEQLGFYNSLLPGEQGFYSQTIYEASPLNRALKSLSPGSAWVIAGRGTASQYLLNTGSDSVRIWELNSGGLPATSKIYSPGELTKTVSIDENNHQIISYVDKLGRTVLEKKQMAAAPAKAHADWLCTYYVYDDLDKLRFVIPPLAVAKINGSWNITTVTGLCRVYVYDNRGRVIVNKMPDADSTEMVYDIKDRLVFTRDGSLRARNQWLATFYDAQGRQIMTALYNTTAKRADLQSSMNTAIANSQNIAYTFPGTADLVLGLFDGTTALYQATNTITLQNGFDAGSGTELTLEINSSATNGTATVVTTNSLPNIPSAALTPLTYTFYDDYSFTGKQNALSTDFGKPKAGSNPNPDLFTTPSNMTQGLVTGNKVRVLGTDKWLTSTIYYNDRGRASQVISENTAGSSDVITTLYNFSGNVLSTYERHRNQSSGVTPQTTILTMVAYDHAGRPLSITKQLNDAGVSKTVAQYRYDELGNHKSKVLGAAIDSLEYEYNVQGWLNSINKGYAINGDAEGKNHHFGTVLSYDKGFSPAQYNGSIAGVTWRAYNDKEYRSYGFSYDAADRLMKADFTQYNGGWNTSAGINFSVRVGDGTNPVTAYDPNGNILSMTQLGLKGAASSTIDQLTYAYMPNTNKLQAVTDAANDPASTLGDFKELASGSSTDYKYDTSGNLIRDDNKGITAITYNHLDLPELISVKGKGTIRYQYNAKGDKLKKTITDSTVTPVRITSVDYMGGLVYQNDSLRQFTHEEGRVRMVYKTGAAPLAVYDYFVTDHLGSVRTVLTEQSDFTMYTATMETEKAASETALFSNLEETRTAKPVGYPSSEGATDGKNSFVAKLNARAGGNKIGPSLVLRVMAGDTVRIGAKAFYKSQAPVGNRQQVPVEDMIAGLVQAFGQPAAPGNGHSAVVTDNNTPFTTNFYNNHYQRLREKDTEGNHQDRPRSYLNFVLFDDRFNLVENNSGVRQVKGEPDVLQTLAVDEMPIEKSGFLYVYTSNETEQDVYFDDLTVTNTTGPVLEETHYYPFGLTMDGISSMAVSKLQNRVLYQGKEWQHGEFNDGTGLEWYDFSARNYDPQLGRWFVQDPAYQDQNPYMAMANVPTTVVDPDGRFAMIPAVLIGAWVGGALGSVKAHAQRTSIDLGMFKGAVVGALTSFLGSFGGGTFAQQVLWGLGEGAAVGGVNAALWNENIGQGILKGAVSGAAYAAAFAGVESVTNWAEGYGFGTNDGRLSKMVEAVKDKDGFMGVNKQRATDVLAYWRKKYGGPEIHYSYFGKDGSAWTNPITGEIEVVPDDFLHGAGALKRTLVHETAHHYKSLIWQNGTPTGKVRYEGTDIIPGHGTIGYYDAIRQAGKYHVGYGAITDVQKVTGLVRTAWKSFDWKKWWYLIPRR